MRAAPAPFELVREGRSMDAVSPKIRRVVIVDDSRTAQAIIEGTFERRSDFKIVGIASDANEGNRLVRQMAPDIVTIDLAMPPPDGWELLDMLDGVDTVCKVVVSEKVSSSIVLASKLEARGASLCVAKRSLIANPTLFFRKLNAACDVIDAARWEREEQERRAAAHPHRVALPLGVPEPLDEDARLEAVARKQLANAMHERQFDLITRYVAEATDFPVCLLTFIDRDTQWIKSAYGFDGGRMPRAEAFCSHTIASGQLLVTHNAATDRRFRSLPIVAGEPGIRTYAGQPIVDAAGVRLGALCLLDTKVRSVGAGVVKQLADMSAIIGSLIDQRPSVAVPPMLSVVQGGLDDRPALVA